MIRDASVFAGILLALFIVGEQSLGFAREQEPAEETAENKIDQRSSDWGPVNHTLQMRASVPVELEQGLVLPLKLEFQRESGQQKSDIMRLNKFLRDEYIELLLTDPNQNKSWIIKPFDPTLGMPPPPDTNRSSVPLDGSQIEPWEVRIPLVQFYKEQQPGDYTARVRFKFPQQPTSFWKGTNTEWNDAGFWHGALVTDPFQLKLLQEVPRTKTLSVPKRLRFRTQHVRLREEDQHETPLPAVYFDKRDIEQVEIPVRNGHSLCTWLYLNGEPARLGGGLLTPDGPNAVDVWYDYKGGDRTATYTIEVFESADPPQHGWMPGPGSAGYKTLWKKTYRVSYSREKL